MNDLRTARQSRTKTDLAIRRAQPSEAMTLTELALRSKAYWGYDEAFMAACREALMVTEKKITQHHVCLASESSDVAGFYCLIVNGASGILDDMFIDPLYIGTGCGRCLWDHMLAKAKEMGVCELTIDADPNAEGFYLKMGAERIGEVESTVFKGRKLPLMKMTVR